METKKLTEIIRVKSAEDRWLRVGTTDSELASIHQEAERIAAMALPAPHPDDVALLREARHDVEHARIILEGILRRRQR